ncbi:MAG: bifunctional 5,10-methylenetetrahydrofolate dehydrogenase/5,10-methenyltetrahydrofolate cyclohydrolase [Syntrophomonas sp.]
MKIISGTEISQEIRKNLQEANQRDGISPVLAIILVGDNKEDMIYVGLKEKAVKSIGGQARLVCLPQNVTKPELIANIGSLNQDDTVDGILLQLPLPQHLEKDVEEILSTIRPDKDVDGFSPINRGLLSGNSPSFASCAALGCMEIINRIFPSLEGRKALLAGNSFDLIIPLGILLIKRGCRLTVIPDYDPCLIKGNDILVIEKGAARIARGEDMEPGMLVIDAGFYWGAGGSCGNVDRKAVEGTDGYLLPVPGGLGPLLITKLMENLITAARRNRGL